MEENMKQDAGVNSSAQGIYAITLFVEDLDTTKRYYRDIFDLPIVYRGPNSAVFKFGDTLINLLKSQRRIRSSSLQKWQAA